VWIADGSQRGPWLLSIDHSGVAAELGTSSAAQVHGPGLATFVLKTLTELHAALDRVYTFAVSLRDAPLARFPSAFDGAWSVTITTDRGGCGPASLGVVIENGVLQYAGATTVAIRGRVTKNGAIQVSVASGDRSASVATPPQFAWTLGVEP
jgi:hypothetical protein